MAISKSVPTNRGPQHDRFKKAARDLGCGEDEAAFNEAPRKPRRPVEDPAEYERFVEAARKLEVDESPDALDRAFDRVVQPIPKKPTEPKG